MGEYFRSHDEFYDCVRILRRERDDPDGTISIGISGSLVAEKKNRHDDVDIVVVRDYQDGTRACFWGFEDGPRSGETFHVTKYPKKPPLGEYPLPIHKSLFKKQRIVWSRKRQLNLTRRG